MKGKGSGFRRAKQLYSVSRRIFLRLWVKVYFHCGSTNTEPGAVATGTEKRGVHRYCKLIQMEMLFIAVPPGRYRSRFCIPGPMTR